MKISKIINNFEFENFINSRKGSSGVPIGLIESQYVIGIHKGGNQNKNTIYGTFIGSILDKLESDDNSELYEDINPFEILNITSEQY